MPLFHTQGDFSDVAKIVEGIAFQSEETRLVALFEPADFSSGEDRLRCVSRPDREEHRRIEDAEAVEVLRFSDRGGVIVRADRERDTRAVQQLQVVTMDRVEVLAAIGGAMADRRRDDTRATAGRLLRVCGGELFERKVRDLVDT